MTSGSKNKGFDGIMVWAAGLIAISLLVPLRAVAQKSNEPLPLNVAMATHDHDSRSSFQFSPDGLWIAHTWSAEDTVPESRGFTETGAPMAEGNYRKQVSITNVTTGESIVLGNQRAYNWAPVWSPDGTRVAFYSDDGGEAGVWIWEKKTNKTTRFPGVIARAFFGFEILRWSQDSKSILAKVVPEGMTLKQANDLMPKKPNGREFPEVGPDRPRVIVKSAGAKKEEQKPSAGVEDSAWTNRSLCDLAILNLADQSVKRIAKKVKASWFEFSPDQKSVAYTTLMGWLANTQQSQWQIYVYSLADGSTRKIAENVYLNYGIELNWSPNGKFLAYIASGQMGKGDISVISVADGNSRTLSSQVGTDSKNAPTFNTGEGEWPPLWDPSGAFIYAVGQKVSVLQDDASAENKVWKVDVNTGLATVVGQAPGYKIVALITQDERRKLWSTDNGQSLWAVVHEKGGRRQGICKIDTKTAKATIVVEEAKSYADVFSLDGSEATQSIAYISRDQQHLADIWILDTKTGQTHQVTHLNQAMERYALGSARLIDFHGMDGQQLHGALLLPPDYRKGRRLPLVVWVYGGSMGSSYVNRFGFWGDYPQFDFHILATRGYAVLFPDTPLGEGTPMRDLLKTVIPAVDAAVEQGYADPERVAVMGQSYGSYSVLALIAQTTRFKAAVITAAVLNPDLFADYLHGGTGYYEQGQGNMHGTIWDHYERYRENSPLFLFDRIETPLLIGQGAEDGDLTPSDTIFEALKRLNKTVEYRVYDGEGHVLTQMPNMLDFWERRLSFLAENLDVALDAKGAAIFDGDRAKSRQ